MMSANCSSPTPAAIIGRGGPRRPTQHHRRAAPAPAAAAPSSHRAQDTIREARQAQLKATDLLSALLQSTQPTVVAEEHLESLNEEFFQLGSLFMQMAHKENNTEVYGQLKAALQAAMEVKQRTLRPEIQLLNQLLAVEDGTERRRVLNRRVAGETLLMNDRYFFTLLARMVADVERQPSHLPQRGPLLRKLAAIKEEATARLPPGA